jgi:two-component system, OmpR family, response regulator MtrA
LARLNPSSPFRHRSEGDRPPHGITRPRTGLTLLVLDSSMDLAGIVWALRARGLRPGIAPLARSVEATVSEMRPRAVILQAGVPSWSELLRFLNHRHIPTVLLVEPEHLRITQGEGAVTIQLLMPAETAEIVEATEFAIGPNLSTAVPDVIDLGIIRIDVRGCVAEIEGRDVEPPPKEFEILVALALQPGEPLMSDELLTRLWPGSRSATIDDVHKRVSRLRRFIGDRDRDEPLIGTRRGYGYVLNVPVEVD